MRLMNKRFITLTVCSVTAMLAPVAIHGEELAFDAKGNLFVLDDRSILKFDPGGTKTTFATLLRKPTCLAADQSGNLFLADSGGTILKVTPDGTKSTLATGFKKPFCLTTDRVSNVFVADADAQSVFKVTPTGKTSALATGLQHPGCPVLGGSGNVLVSDYDSHSIFKFTPEGVKSTFATGLKDPTALAFDPAGNLFVYDNIENSIFKFTPEGTKTTFATGLNLRENPHCLICDRSGNLFVADDFTSHSIFKFTTDGNRSTFASDFDAAEMAFDAASNLFVRAGNHSAIFKFDADGNQTTFASDWISPDKKWEYVGGDDPKIVETGAKDAALHLSDQGPGKVLWAPDSKRLAYNYGQGRTHQTLLYQLRDDQWLALDAPSDNDEIDKRANDIVAGQLKKDGLSERKLEKQGKFLRLIWWTVQVDRWLDSNTAIVYASLRQVAARRDAPGEMDNGYGTDLLFTISFDADGKWKIVKTHRMSKKELEGEQ